MQQVRRPVRAIEPLYWNFSTGFFARSTFFCFVQQTAQISSTWICLQGRFEVISI
jgi:hypothetical protein